MRSIASIRDELNKVHGLVFQWERRLAVDDSLAARLNAGSLRKRAADLEKELLEVAKRTSTDICSYRIFHSDETQPQLNEVSRSLTAFQAALTTVFDSITDQPKERVSRNPSALKRTALEFGYSFAGSAGIVFTIPDERLLFEDITTNLDDSIKLMFAVVGTSSSEGIGAFVSTIGHGGIRAIREWAKSHAVYGTGADIGWYRGPEPIASRFIQYEEWNQLTRTIDETSSESSETLVLLGELVKANIPGKSFTMQFADFHDISGKFADAIGWDHNATIPARYKATIIKTIKTQYAMDEDEESYFLDKLEPL